MKQKIYKLLFTIIAVAFSLPLGGCFSDFEPDIETVPVLCLNSLVTEDRPIELSVTRTWRWSENNFSGRDSPLAQSDADVRLFVNGEYVETMRFVHEKASWNNEKDRFYFLADYLPKEGDRIRFEVTSPEYGEATAEVTLPDKVDITKVTPRVNILSKIKDSELDKEYLFSLQMYVDFTDPKGMENFYSFKLSETCPEGYVDDNNLYHGPEYYEYITPCDFDMDLEPLFSEHISPLESVITDNYGWTVFSDRQIEGRKYSLNIVNENMTYHYDYNSGEHSSPAKRGSTLDIQLCSISKSYYDYMISLWQTEYGISGALGGVGLGNPVWEKSNVSTGAGVVAAQTVSEVRLDQWKLVNGEY